MSVQNDQNMNDVEEKRIVVTQEKRKRKKKKEKRCRKGKIKSLLGLSLKPRDDGPGGWERLNCIKRIDRPCYMR